MSAATPVLPPVVLLHGAGGNAATWAPVLDRWPAGQNIVVVDLPGRGSRPGEPARSAAEAAAQIRGDLPEGALLVGHSYGGAVALELVLADPGGWAGLVMVSSASRLGVSPQILALVQAATDAAPASLDFAFGPQCPATVRAEYGLRAATTPAASTLADWVACQGFDRRASVPDVACPALVLHGDADTLTVPRFQARLAQDLQRSHHTALPGVGHMLPWEAPDAMVAAVYAWWRRR